MAVAYIVDFPGASAEDYDAVIDRMQLGDRLPPGALFHAAGPTDEGWRVCDVWESEQAFEQFAEAKIRPLTAERGMAPPRTRRLEVNEIRRGAAGPIGLVQVVTLPGLDAEAFLALDRAILGPERTLPEGCPFHVNGRLEGEWSVLAYWSTREQRDRFLEERVQPAVAATGVTSMPQMDEVSVHNALTEPAAHPAGV